MSEHPNKRFHDISRDLHGDLLMTLAKRLSAMESAGDNLGDIAATLMSALCLTMGDVLMASTKEENYDSGVDIMAAHIKQLARARLQSFRDAFGCDPHAVGSEEFERIIKERSSAVH